MAGDQAKVIYSNLKLCDGIEAGIEVGAYYLHIRREERGEGGSTRGKGKGDGGESKSIVRYGGRRGIRVKGPDLGNLAQG